MLYDREETRVRACPLRDSEIGSILEVDFGSLLTVEDLGNTIIIEPHLLLECFTKIYNHVFSYLFQILNILLLMI